MLLVCAREKTLIFSLFPSVRGRRRGGLLEGGGHPLEEIRFFCFFNTIRYKKGKENLLK